MSDRGPRELPFKMLQAKPLVYPVGATPLGEGGPFQQEARAHARPHVLTLPSRLWHMTTPSTELSKAYAMNATDARDFIAAVRPPSGSTALAAYLDSAIRALGGRADVDLARSIGVPAATIASWKRRGSVPEDKLSWFTTTLTEKIAEYRSDIAQAEYTARAAVLTLAVQLGGDVVQGQGGGGKRHRTRSWRYTCVSSVSRRGGYPSGWRRAGGGACPPIGRGDVGVSAWRPPAYSASQRGAAIGAAIAPSRSDQPRARKDR